MERSPLNRRTFLGLAAGATTMLRTRHGSAAGPTSGTGYDIVIYGGSSAGVMAAVQAQRMGKTAVIVNPYSFLGGMTSSGLSAIDAALNPAAVSGLAREFGLAKPYGREVSARIEPHVAEKTFNDFVTRANVPVFHNERLDLKRGVILNGKRIVSIRMENGRSFPGKMFIDATYEGDLTAKAGVTYVVGRESNAQYGETLNGFQRVEAGYGAPWAGAFGRLSDIGAEDHFVQDVDPYVVRGDPASGLLPRISRTLLKNGEADHRAQAYNYRVILTDDPANQIPFDKPEGYQALDHELLLRNFEAGDERLPGRLQKISNRKIDWNTFGAVGTDMAGANVDYAEADHETRVKIDRLHELYTRGHFWTLANHPRVPQSIRTEMRRWGYAKDEFQRNGGFPYMLYLREGRRMVSDYVMTEQHCFHQKTAADPVTLATYAVDSHVVQYVVNERGFAQREGVILKQAKGPYGVSYRSIVPQQGECPNLLVPICVSASHVAYGSIRMEPIYISLAQASATAASMAIDRSVPVQQVPYAQLRERLLADQVMLEWKT